VIFITGRNLFWFFALKTVNYIVKGNAGEKRSLCGRRLPSGGKAFLRVWPLKPQPGAAALKKLFWNNINIFTAFSGLAIYL
jgi:hypothetical protein